MMANVDTRKLQQAERILHAPESRAVIMKNKSISIDITAGEFRLLQAVIDNEINRMRTARNIAGIAADAAWVLAALAKIRGKLDA
jgi:hypothetical protein